MDAFETALIDQVYSAGLIPELWPNVIERLSVRMKAGGGSLFVLSDGHLSWDASPATKPIMEEYIAEGWDKKNPRLTGLLKYARPGFIQDSDVAEGDYESLPIVREFLRPRDIAFTAATVIKGARDDLAVFSIDRGMSAGRFTSADIDWLDNMRPHLSRSMALASRLKMQQAAAAANILQMIGVPAAVLANNQSVIATNSLFDALEGYAFVSSAFGRIILKDRRAHRVLQQALDIGSDHAPVVRSIPVAGPQGAIGVLHAIPSRKQANDILGAGSTLLVLAQTKKNASVDAEWLKWLYDLSPTEAQVAAQLTRGLNVEEIAADNGSSMATTRTHVKHLLRKTGFNRQTDFIQSASSLAAIKPSLPSVVGEAPGNGSPGLRRKSRGPVQQGRPA